MGKTRPLKGARASRAAKHALAFAGFVALFTLYDAFASSGSSDSEWKQRKFPVEASDVWAEAHSLVPGLHVREFSRTSMFLKAHDAAKSSTIVSSQSGGASSRLCRVPKLPVQVDNPFRSKSAMGKIKRSYVCLRFEKQCRGQAMEELWNRRYMKKYDTYEGTFLMTDTTALNRLKKDDSELFKRVVKGREGEAYISALDGGDAISGNKAKQLATKRDYVEKFHCDYNDLRIQPAQYTLSRPSECKKFLSFARAHPNNMWILKPVLGQGGVGITLHDNHLELEKRFGDCKLSNAQNRFIVQDYVQKPLLIHNKKFDMRVYMLVASSNPYLVFYHRGYLRRAIVDYDEKSKEKTVFLTNTHYQSTEKKFELSDHIWGFDRFQKYLADNGVAGAHYVSTVLDSAIKKVLLFNFHSAKNQLSRRKGSYHLFGLDFMIDDELRVHFIEANGYPGFTWSRDFPTRKLVTTMFDLLLELHESPAGLQRMTKGDKYGDFELLYNELEDGCDDRAYDPCVEFSRFNDFPMKKVAKKVSSFHDSKKRTLSKASKAKKKAHARANAECRKSSLSDAECEKHLRKKREELFRNLFEKQYNYDVINVFVKGM